MTGDLDRSDIIIFQSQEYMASAIFSSMAIGTMTLHRFNGDEIFNVEDATIKSHKLSDNLMAVTFLAKAEKIPVKTLPDTAPHRAHPFAEVIVHLTPSQLLALNTGQSFLVPKGYDEQAEEYKEYLTNFYYFEHEPMDDNEITILGRSGSQIRARVSGMVTDVNYYDGSKPKTKVIVEATFTLS